MVGIGSGFLTLLQSLYILLQLPERAIRGIASLDDRRITAGALVFERRGIQRISQFIAIPLLILFTESLDVRFAVRIEEFLAALLPRRFECGRCDVPVRAAFLGNRAAWTVICLCLGLCAAFSRMRTADLSWRLPHSHSIPCI